MPKRVIDFDAMWGSDKLAACAEWAQAEYAWLYGLADASGSFELTNFRVIWGRVAAIRRNLTLERLEQVFGEFRDKGLIFVWEENGKRYGHWTGSDVPGRLPPPSWRMRLERLAPPVPKQQLAEFTSRFSRGRAASAGGGFLVDTAQADIKGGLEATHGRVASSAANHFAPVAASDRACNDRVEDAQAQDWNWDRGLDGNGDGGGNRARQRAYEAEPGHGREHSGQNPFSNLVSSANTEAKSSVDESANANSERQTKADSSGDEATNANASPSTIAAGNRRNESRQNGVDARPRYQSQKDLQLARDLLVGLGPSTRGPVSVKPEALARMHARDALARLRGRDAP